MTTMRTTAYERLTDALRNHGCHGRERSWQCPAHEDRAPSLSVTQGEKGVVVRCHAGCSTQDVTAALGLTMADLFDEPRDTPARDRTTTEYRYTDEHGTPLFIVKRFEPGFNGERKTFRQYDRTGKPGLNGARRVLYRLPEITAAARAGRPVYIVEGEKDVDTLRAHGAVATCNVGGAGKWRPEYTDTLRGITGAVIIADRDDPGRRHALHVAQSLAQAGIPARIVEPTRGKDITDHLAAGGTLDDLTTAQPLPGDAHTTSSDQDPHTDLPHPADVADAEPDPDTDVTDRFPRLDWHDAFATDFSQINWMLGQFMEHGQQVTLVGDGKSGKSLFTLDWIYRAITERPFLGDQHRPPLRVLYFDRENSRRDIVTRLKSLGATHDDLDTFTERFDYRLFPRFSGALDASTTAAAELLAIVEDTQPDLVVLDTVSRFIGGNENDSATWLDFYRRVHAPLKARGIACLRLDHTGKDRDRGSRGSSAKSQDVDHVWELSATPGGAWHNPGTGLETITTHLKLKRSHTRTGLGEDAFTITRRGLRQRGGDWLPGGTRHELTAHSATPDEPPAEGTPQWLARQLDAAGVPRDWGSPKVRHECARLGIRAGTQLIQDAVKLRKSDTYLPVSNLTSDLTSERSSGEVSGEVTSPHLPNHETPGHTSPGDPEVRSGEPQAGGPHLPPIEGEVRSDSGPSKINGKRPGERQYGICNICHTRMVVLHPQQTTHPGCEPDTPHPEREPP